MANFVVRLNDETESKLSAYMAQWNIKTKNGAITACLNDVAFLQDQHSQLLKKYSDLTQKHDVLVSEINDFFNARDNLINLTSLR